MLRGQFLFLMLLGIFEFYQADAIPQEGDFVRFPDHFQIATTHGDDTWTLGSINNAMYVISRVVDNISMKQVSAGLAGIVAVSNDNKAYYRTGVSSTNIAGTAWVLLGVPADIIHEIESGPAATIHGLNQVGEILCIDGDLTATPIVTSWRAMDPATKLKEITSSSFGSWGIKTSGELYRRAPATQLNPANCANGESPWVLESGNVLLKHIKVNQSNGKLYGIDIQNRLVIRQGITEAQPGGQAWLSPLPQFEISSLSIGNGKIDVVCDNGELFSYTFPRVR